jgi:hypothetical protein
MAGMEPTKALQIFKAGRHTAMSGAVLEFSESHLAACANAYDPAKHEAPIVVGHPRTDGPAYGWVKGLGLKAGIGLEAEPHQVDPAFAEMVAAGRYKKISASFFTPDSPSNPVPGVYYLRHVGFLGAQPPAVKGLRNPEFAESDEGVVSFADVDDLINASLWRRMRDFIIAQFGLDKADSVIPDYAVANLEAEARAEPDDGASTDDSAASATSSFASPIDKGDEMSVEDKARLEALEAENKRLKDEAAGRARIERHAANASFADALVKEGRLAPGHRPMIVSFMDHVSDNAEASIEFAEGGGTKKCAPLDAFKSYLQAQPELIEFREAAGADKGDAVEFADAKSLADAATAYQTEQEKAGVTINHAQAVAHVAAKAKR